MKVLLLIAATAAFSFAQEGKPITAKPAPAITKEVAQPAERKLTREEVLEFQVALKDVAILRQKYRLEEFNKEVQSLSQIQLAIYTAACSSIGISQEKINRRECNFDIGLDEDGKPVMRDGKPVEAKVSVRPPTVETPAQAKK